jgi:hypothetical protein
LQAGACGADRVLRCAVLSLCSGSFQAHFSPTLGDSRSSPRLPFSEADIDAARDTGESFSRYFALQFAIFFQAHLTHSVLNRTDAPKVPLIELIVRVEAAAARKIQEEEARFEAMDVKSLVALAKQAPSIADAEVEAARDQVRLFLEFCSSFSSSFQGDLGSGGEFGPALVCLKGARLSVARRMRRSQRWFSCWCARRRRRRNGRREKRQRRRGGSAWQQLLGKRGCARMKRWPGSCRERWMLKSRRNSRRNIRRNTAVTGCFIV